MVNQLSRITAIQGHPHFILQDTYFLPTDLVQSFNKEPQLLMIRTDAVGSASSVSIEIIAKNFENVNGPVS